MKPTNRKTGWGGKAPFQPVFCLIFSNRVAENLVVEEVLFPQMGDISHRYPATGRFDDGFCSLWPEGSAELKTFDPGLFQLSSGLTGFFQAGNADNLSQSAGNFSVVLLGVKGPP